MSDLWTQPEVWRALQVDESIGGDLHWPSYEVFSQKFDDFSELSSLLEEDKIVFPCWSIFAGFADFSEWENDPLVWGNFLEGSER